MGKVWNTKSHILCLFQDPNFWMFRAIYSNLDKFHYTYGSGNFKIILRPVRQNEGFHRSLIWSNFKHHNYLFQDDIDDSYRYLILFISVLNNQCHKFEYLLRLSKNPKTNILGLVSSWFYYMWISIKGNIWTFSTVSL